MRKLVEGILLGLTLGMLIYISIFELFHQIYHIIFRILFANFVVNIVFLLKISRITCICGRKWSQTFSVFLLFLASFWAFLPSKNILQIKLA